MTQAYIDLLRSYQLLQNAKDNVVINKKIYEDVQSLYDQGLTTKSEMTKNICIFIFGKFKFGCSTKQYYG